MANVKAVVVKAAPRQKPLSQPARLCLFRAAVQWIRLAEPLQALAVRAAKVAAYFAPLSAQRVVAAPAAKA